eukprot:CAMPEP_0174969628 /NCGR_PEP_ID=MMETSP0004_2-20121128/8880_1 /TAXON_ID=420556 /ORGANISM="Ochromonas sp., Strain CCMP1393" /LENGTH=193 /DNA_ID=CAMNT_0016219163 /DNA_START=67 /DNA_END=648 /DNA_ORIENTATION=-
MFNNAGFLINKQRIVTDVTSEAKSRYANIDPNMIFYSYRGGKIADLNKSQIDDLLCNGSQQDLDSFRFLSKLEGYRSDALHNCGFFVSNYRYGKQAEITEVDPEKFEKALSQPIEPGMIFEKYYNPSIQSNAGWRYIRDLSRQELHQLLTNATAAERNTFRFLRPGEVISSHQSDQALNNVGFYTTHNSHDIQ